MTVELIHTVIDAERYLERYKAVFSCQGRGDALYHYASVSQTGSADGIPMELRPFIVETEGRCLTRLPVLTPENTDRIAHLLREAAESTCGPLERGVSDMAALFGKNSGNTIHNLLVHIVLGNLWQFLWARRVSGTGCGSLALIVRPEECPVLLTRILTLDETTVFAYWRNRLQKNNWMLNQVCRKRQTLKMLRSADADGFVLPMGGMEGPLLEMKLLRSVHVDGSYVPSFRMTVPGIDVGTVRSVQPILHRMTAAVLPPVDAALRLLEGSIRAVDPAMEHVPSEDLLTACYPVFSFACYHAWLNQGILESPAGVPHLYDQRT